MKRWIVATAFVVFCSPVLLGDEPKPEPKKFELTEEEKELLELTNKERKAKGLSELTVAPKLFVAARNHAVNMAKQKKLEHTLDGVNPFQRVKATGYRYRVMAENISWGQNVKLDAIMKGWMESKIHRDNILNPELKQIGLGYAKNEDGDIYCAQVFGTPLR